MPEELPTLPEEYTRYVVANEYGTIISHETTLRGAREAKEEAEEKPETIHGYHVFKEEMTRVDEDTQHVGGTNQVPEEPDGYFYARGVFRSLAEDKYHQPRQERLHHYWNRPTGEEVVEVMVERGWDEEVALDAVRRLWLNQRKCMKYRAVEP